MQKMQPKRFPKKLKQLFSTSLFHMLALGLTLFAIWYGYTHYRVSEIRIVSRNKNISIRGLDNYYHSSMLTLREKELEQTLKNLNPAIYSIRVKKEFPSIINIYIEYGQVAAQFAADEGYLLLSADGVVYRRQRAVTAGIPVITYYQRISYAEYQPGSKLSQDEVEDTLYFLQSVADLGMRVSQVDIKGGHMIRLMLTEEDAVIVVTTEKDRLRQAYEMHQILKRLKVQGQGVRTLDLRFDKPVITLK